MSGGGRFTQAIESLARGEASLTPADLRDDPPAEAGLWRGSLAGIGQWSQAVEEGVQVALGVGVAGHEHRPSSSGAGLGNALRVV
jgi:hypothetical protein